MHHHHRPRVSHCAAPHLVFGQNLYLGPLVTEEEIEAARGGGGEAKKMAAEAKDGTDIADQDQSTAKAGGGESAGGGDDGDGGIVDRAAEALEQLSATGR